MLCQLKLIINIATKLFLKPADAKSWKLEGEYMGATQWNRLSCPGSYYSVRDSIDKFFIIETKGE